MKLFKGVENSRNAQIYFTKKIVKLFSCRKGRCQEKGSGVVSTTTISVSGYFKEVYL